MLSSSAPMSYQAPIRPHPCLQARSKSLAYTGTALPTIEIDMEQTRVKRATNWKHAASFRTTLTVDPYPGDSATQPSRSTPSSPMLNRSRSGSQRMQSNSHAGSFERDRGSFRHELHRERSTGHPQSMPTSNRSSMDGNNSSDHPNTSNNFLSIPNKSPTHTNHASASSPRLTRHPSMEAWHHQFTHKQLKAIHVTWLRLKHEQTNSKSNALRMLERIFELFKRRHQNIGTIFAKAAFVDGMIDAVRASKQRQLCTYRDHPKELYKFLEQMVAVTQSGNRLGSESVDIENIGCQHAHLANVGFSGEMWEQFGECMIEVVIRHESLQVHTEAKKAWMILVAMFIDRIRHGFDKEVTQNRRRLQQQESFSMPTAATGLLTSPTSQHMLPTDNHFLSPNDHRTGSRRPSRVLRSNSARESTHPLDDHVHQVNDRFQSLEA